MHKIEKKIKLLSVNEVWQGKRYKTKKYDTYEKILGYTLPNEKINSLNSYYIIFIFNFILQKKYGFNDRDIYIALTYKKIVPKKDEGFIVYIGDSKNFYKDLETIKKQQKIE
jgi:hypothetical protein